MCKPVESRIPQTCPQPVVAGTGENQMLDVTVNYEEIYSDADDDELNLPDAGE